MPMASRYIRKGQGFDGPEIQLLIKVSRANFAAVGVIRAPLTAASAKWIDAITDRPRATKR